MRIAMVVPNPCAPDFRVQKQAETLAMAGHEVCVFCTMGSGLPAEEIRAKVRYRRLNWQPRPPLVAMKGLFRVPGPHRQRSGAVISPPVKLEAAGVREVPHGRLARLIGPRYATILRQWISRRIQTVYQPYLEASFARVFVPAISAFDPDAVHAHDLLSLPGAATVTRETGARLIFDSHELEAHRNPPLTPARRRQVERMEARLLIQATAVLTVGDRIADHLAQEYGIARPLVIYNSPRLADQQSGPPLAVPDIRSLAGAPDNALVLAYTGNIAPNRGLETAIDALGLLRSRGDDRPGGRPVCLVAMGRCPPAHAIALTERAEKRAVQDRLFLVPPVAPEIVSRQIASADAALIPIIPRALSYEYAMPNKLFEAIMAGLPVLASDLTEMGDFLRRTGLGTTFKPEDPAAMADAIHAAFPDGKGAISSPSTTLIESISWEAQAEKLTDLYARLSH